MRIDIMALMDIVPELGQLALESPNVFRKVLLLVFVFDLKCVGVLYQ